jgi:hypothetical protein
MTSCLITIALPSWLDFGQGRTTTENKQMNIEQGMSKEEGGNRHEKAQKAREVWFD